MLGIIMLLDILVRLTPQITTIICHHIDILVRLTPQITTIICHHMKKKILLKKKKIQKYGD